MRHVIGHTFVHMPSSLCRHNRGMDLPPSSGGKDDGIQLKQITVVTSDDDLQPPPYSEQVTYTNGSLSCQNSEKPNGTVSPTKSPPLVSMTISGISNDSAPQTVNQSQLSVTQSSIRRRHKSDGSLPQQKSTDLLDPTTNHRKASWCDSRSTLNGAKFDDSFVGKLIQNIPLGEEL